MLVNKDPRFCYLSDVAGNIFHLSDKTPLLVTGNSSEDTLFTMQNSFFLKNTSDKDLVS